MYFFQITLTEGKSVRSFIEAYFLDLKAGQIWGQGRTCSTRLSLDDSKL
jgi:hypothetical protein